MSNVEYSSNNVIVTIDDGDFSAHTANRMRPLFEDLTQKTEQVLVVIDVSSVAFIDSSGIGALVFLYKRLTSQSRKLVLVGLSGQPEETMRMLRINRILKNYDSLEECLAEENVS